MMPLPATVEAELADVTENEAYVEPAVFNGIYCDGCGVNPIVGPRFK